MSSTERPQRSSRPFPVRSNSEQSIDALESDHTSSFSKAASLRKMLSMHGSSSSVQRSMQSGSAPTRGSSSSTSTCKSSPPLFYPATKTGRMRQIKKKIPGGAPTLHERDRDVPYFPPPPGCSTTRFSRSADTASATFGCIARISASGTSVITAISFPNAAIKEA